MAEPSELRDRLLEYGVQLGKDRVLELRARLLEWANSANPTIAEVGRHWTAALGACIQLVSRPPSEARDLPTQIEAYYAAGARAWMQQAARNWKVHSSQAAESSISIRTAPITDRRSF